MSGGPSPEGVPPGAPFVPQGPVPFIATTNPNTMDYPRLVYTAPRFEVVAIADIIEPSVLEACEALLPTLVPPYVNQAAIDAVNAMAVLRAGDTMTGPLNLSPVIPTANAMAASKQYVDTMIATGAIPEVPPVPANQAWARETGQWVPIAGGGTVTNIATGAGLTGGPITATGTISMASMNANTLKGNATGAVAAPTDLNVGQVMTMLGAAPLNSPAFTGTPSLPTGTAAVTQPGGTNNTSVATTAFVANLVANYAPLASPVFTGAPSLPTGTIAVTQTPGTSNTTVATTAFVGTALGSYLPLTGGTLAGPGNLTVRGGILGGAAGSVPAAGSLTLNANAVAPPAAPSGYPANLQVAGVDATNTTILVDTFGGATVAPFILGRHARGTAASRAAVQSGDYLLGLNGLGYDGAAYAAQAAILQLANETWTGSAHGTQIQLSTTPNGSTSPVTSLSVAGNNATFSANVAVGQLFFSSNIAASSARINADASNLTFSLPTSNGSHQFTNNAGTVIAYFDSVGDIIISGNTAQKPTGTTWSNPSSRDLKENIQPYAQGLQAILALQPRTFTFAADSGIDAAGEHIGLIHDETAHMPEMHRTMTIGTGDDAREVDGLDCSAIMFAVINAIKELKAEIDSLKGSAP